MKRNGTKLQTLRDGHPRRMSDARNAWRKMSDEQRAEFLTFIAYGVKLPKGCSVEAPAPEGSL